LLLVEDAEDVERQCFAGKVVIAGEGAAERGRPAAEEDDDERDGIYSTGMIEDLTDRASSRVDPEWWWKQDNFEKKRL
jgi:hypothetical protein